MELLLYPDVCRVFQCLLKFGRVTESFDNYAAIDHCHCNGWIYAEDLTKFRPQSYIPSSPLHHAALSQRVQARDNVPWFETAYVLSLQVLWNCELRMIIDSQEENLCNSLITDMAFP